MDIAQIIIPNIILHETIDRLKINVPIIHPVHCTALEIVKKKHKKVVLFGSKYTMESNYIKNIFRDYHIAILVPSKAERDLIDLVRIQIYQKTINNNMLDNYNLIIKKYAQNNAVVLACTELSLASTSFNKKVFDMMNIQILKSCEQSSTHSD